MPRGHNAGLGRTQVAGQVPNRKCWRWRAGFTAKRKGANKQPPSERTWASRKPIPRDGLETFRQQALAE